MIELSVKVKRKYLFYFLKKKGKLKAEQMILHRFYGE